MRPRYCVCVKWPSGLREQFPLPETIPLHLGHGDPSSPVPVTNASGVYVGSLIIHGSERPEWLLTTYPEDLSALLTSAERGELSETEARRIHALADYMTAHASLYELVESALSSPNNWSDPGVFQSNLCRAQNLLESMRLNVDYLLSTPMGAADFALDGVLRRAEQLGFWAKELGSTSWHPK